MISHIWDFAFLFILLHSFQFVYPFFRSKEYNLGLDPPSKYANEQHFNSKTNATYRRFTIYETKQTFLKIYLIHIHLIIAM